MRAHRIWTNRREIGFSKKVILRQRLRFTIDRSRTAVKLLYNKLGSRAAAAAPAAAATTVFCCCRCCRTAVLPGNKFSLIKYATTISRII